MSRRFRNIGVTVVGAALLPVAINLASSSLPDVAQNFIEQHEWAPWLAMVILLVPLVAVQLVRGETEPDDQPVFAGGGILKLRRPEEAANAASTAYRNQRFLDAFRHSVVAVDRLHDFYVFDELRNRQPSARDSWIVGGLTAALCAAREIDPHAEVQNGVVEAAARLRDIADAATRAGLNPRIYVQALADLSRCAPDVET